MNWYDKLFPKRPEAPASVKVDEASIICITIDGDRYVKVVTGQTYYVWNYETKVWDKRTLSAQNAGLNCIEHWRRMGYVEAKTLEDCFNVVVPMHRIKAMIVGASLPIAP